jgi:hypothetical protein
MSNTLSRTPFGLMSLYPICVADNLKGISRRSSRWQVLEAFLLNSEGRAERVYEGRSGFVILMAIPGQPGTGAFYIYDEIHRSFFMVNFADQDNFHASMFDYVVQFYDLGQYVELPKLTLVPKPVSADKVDVASQNKRRSDRRRFNRGPRVPQSVINAAGRTHMGLVTA